MARKIKDTARGFTLVELLVVVTIVAILVGIAVPNFMGAVTRARVARAFAEMRSLGNAVQMYWIDHNIFLGTSTDLTGPGLVYITSIPSDHFNENAARGVKDGALTDKSYGYYTTGDTAWLIVSNGPDKNPDVSADDIDWSARTVGQLGGWEGSKTGYGYNWYDPGDGLSSSGDLGISGP
ncbi:prepilin-type N-terminal cleavage/methylation domain-containing protein [Candidatus Aerophobetes bacterium]|nr:prepilin-type N-terminal cleavage/methylation domain-containing protein [Candidatus Aerophobetes bacterium]